MERRGFLKLVGATVVASAGSSALMGVHAGEEKVPVGIGLYTVRSEMAKGVEQTLAQLSAYGYGEVEFAGYYGHSAKDVQRILGDTGLSSPSAHIPVDVFEQDFDRALEFAHTVGHKYLIMPWVRPEERTLERYKQIFDALNVAAQKAKAAGIHVAYHNHEFEFQSVDGAVPYDLLLERTDPDLVKLQLDLFWMHVAGRDPVVMINEQPGRVHLVHVKDCSTTGDMVDVGDGVIDFDRVFKRAEKAGLKHFLVEHDNPATPFATAENSINYLRRTFSRFG